MAKIHNKPHSIRLGKYDYAVVLRKDGALEMHLPKVDEYPAQYLWAVHKGAIELLKTTGAIVTKMFEEVQDGKEAS